MAFTFEPNRQRSYYEILPTFNLLIQHEDMRWPCCVPHAPLRCVKYIYHQKGVTHTQTDPWARTHTHTHHKSLLTVWTVLSRDGLLLVMNLISSWGRFISNELKRLRPPAGGVFLLVCVLSSSTVTWLGPKWDQQVLTDRICLLSGALRGLQAS